MCGGSAGVGNVAHVWHTYVPEWRPNLQPATLPNQSTPGSEEGVMDLVLHGHFSQSAAMGRLSVGSILS